MSTVNIFKAKGFIVYPLGKLYLIIIYIVISHLPYLF